MSKQHNTSISNALHATVRLSGTGSHGFTIAGCAKNHSAKPIKAWVMDAGSSQPAEGLGVVQFGLMFETLGHVIHHIQDMAQPLPQIGSQA